MTCNVHNFVPENCKHIKSKNNNIMSNKTVYVQIIYNLLDALPSGSSTVMAILRTAIEGNKTANKLFGKLHLYELIFNTKFSISFFPPKKDQYSRCGQYKHSSGVDKVKIRGIYDKQRTEKLFARKEKDNNIQLYENTRTS